MDASTLYVVDSIRTGKGFDIDQFIIMLFIVPLITIILGNIRTKLETTDIFSKIKLMRSPKEKSLTLIGGVSSRWTISQTAEYPEHFLAVMDNIILNKKIPNIVLTNVTGRNWTSLSDYSYMGGQCGRFNIATGIDAQIVQNKIDDKDSGTRELTQLVLYSSTDNLIEFVDKLVIERKEREEAKRSIDKDKRYHFVYQGGRPDEGRIIHTYSKQLLHDFSKPSNETFDNMFSEHVEMLKNNIDQLHHPERYSKLMLKNMLRLILHGAPGTGKTAIVKAMALYDKRHIIEVPISRVKHNEDLENIFTISEICGVPIKKSEVIILFDEIDCADIDLRKKAPVELSTEVVEEPTVELKTKVEGDRSTTYKLVLPDALNIGVFLSTLDGIGDCDGLIIVATTNDIDKLDPAFTRDQRLTPVKCDYCRREDIRGILERFYEVTLSPEQIASLPDREAHVTPANVITIVQNSKTCDETVSKLSITVN